MDYSLYLYVEKSDHTAISGKELTKYLQKIDFLTWSDNSSTLSPGTKLMEYITFLGCSPALQRGEIESTIRIHRFDRMTGLGGNSVETIRYPRCRHPLQAPATLLENYPENTLWRCPDCGHQGEIKEINWRKTAGFSNLFIEISQIFPKEAVPADNLLALLELLTHSSWLWFYSASTR